MKNKNSKEKKIWFVVVQDSKTSKVLTVGRTNENLFLKIKEEKKVYLLDNDFEDLYLVDEYYWNNSKTTLLIKVKVNKESIKYSFTTDFLEENKDDYAYLRTIEKKIQRSVNGEKQNTHVSTVMKKGKSKIAQKFGEESVELVIEAAKENVELFKDEAADVFYYYLILIQERGFVLSDILKQLKLQKRKI